MKNKIHILKHLLKLIIKTVILELIRKLPFRTKTGSRFKTVISELNYNFISRCSFFITSM